MHEASKHAGVLNDIMELQVSCKSSFHVILSFDLLALVVIIFSHSRTMGPKNVVCDIAACYNERHVCLDSA
eukprot:1762533-Amphidinium_carterae.1